MTTLMGIDPGGVGSADHALAELDQMRCVLVWGYRQVRREGVGMEQLKQALDDLDAAVRIVADVTREVSQASRAERRRPAVVSAVLATAAFGLLAAEPAGVLPSGLALVLTAVAALGALVHPARRTLNWWRANTDRVLTENRWNDRAKAMLADAQGQPAEVRHAQAVALAYRAVREAERRREVLARQVTVALGVEWGPDWLSILYSGLLRLSKPLGDLSAALPALDLGSYGASPEARS
ncbi:hypothetical protein Lfu02_75730 [Longispora fulva]|uniref:Uncharacterized protein n=1 Tax=Longispora fulva TaxID=619741 RepID=A0A8J7KFK0_9ACTN|nr:hypothetical protein [Longispora fulva]MBG6136290.1 hypothetical protein [Longispora fulva]GIG63201.1 hypothetical protein Lfu02_75730 [Longispora fulva]